MTTKEAQLNEVTYAGFFVTDSNGDPVPGLTTTSFNIYLFNPSGSEVHSTTTDGIRELGNGLYQYYATFTTEGIWSVLIDHDYLPMGVKGDFEVHEDRALLKRVLGLVQENFYLDNLSYTGDNMNSGRLRIYSDAASVGTTADIIGTYNITASFDSNGKLSNYKIVKS